MAADEPSRTDLQAAVAARRELGPDYEDAVLDSFLERLDRSIAARVDARVAEQNTQRGREMVRRDAPEGHGSDGGLVLALVSLGTGIPITGIAAGTEGVLGLVVAWTGIAMVNVAYALRRRRRD